MTIFMYLWNKLVIKIPDIVSDTGDFYILYYLH